jgi:hypothetical protein
MDRGNHPIWVGRLNGVASSVSQLPEAIGPDAYEMRRDDVLMTPVSMTALEQVVGNGNAIAAASDALFDLACVPRGALTFRMRADLEARVLGRNFTPYVADGAMERDVLARMAQLYDPARADALRSRLMVARNVWDVIQHKSLKGLCMPDFCMDYFARPLNEPKLTALRVLIPVTERRDSGFCLFLLACRGMHQEKFAPPVPGIRKNKRQPWVALAGYVTVYAHLSLFCDWFKRLHDRVAITTHRIRPTKTPTDFYLDVFVDQFLVGVFGVRSAPCRECPRADIFLGNLLVRCCGGVAGYTVAPQDLTGIAYFANEASSAT